MRITWSYIFAGVLFLPHVVHAVATDMPHMIIDGREVEIQYAHQNGSIHHAELRITQTGSVDQKIHIAFEIVDPSREDHVSKDLLSKMRLYDLAQLTHAQVELLQKNHYDITTFCAKEHMKQNEWCQGEKESEFVVAEHSDTIAIIAMHIPDDMREDQTVDAVMRIVDTGEELQRIRMVYHVPDKNIVQMRLQNFALKKEHPLRDVFAWARSGLRDDYVAHIASENVGTEHVDFTYFTEVSSQWIGEKITFSGVQQSAPAETHINQLHATMPRFGKVSVVGGISYTDHDQKLVELRSEPIIMVVWPIHLVSIVLTSICFCGIFVLLYKYIKKYMFGFRKNKKEETQFTGTYVVQDTDNIISIAQMFGVPWKELAEHNKIDAPYILISGETISVPGVSTAKTELGKNAIQQEVITSESNKPEQIKTIYDQPSYKEVETLEQEHQAYAMPESSAVAQQTVMQNRAQVDLSEQSNGGLPHMQKKEQAPIKRKVTFAAPQSMLAQPASEPTTRAIDIEWMRDDEEAYNEEMEFQRKKVNKKLTIFMVLGSVIIGGGLVWGILQWVDRDAKEKVPVEQLISEESIQTQGAQVQQEVAEGMPAESDDDQDTGTATEDPSEQTSAEGKVDEKMTQQEVSEITVQVLNAGAKTGVAGMVSTSFSDKGYKVNAAQNAQNSSAGVTIYFAADQKDTVDAIVQIIGNEYGVVQKEESDDVTEKYKADIVIAIGA